MIVLEYSRVDQNGRVTGFVEELEIDATPVENYNAFAQATSDPVEDGSVISDHTVLAPLTMTFECVISGTPLRRFKDVPGIDRFRSTSPNLGIVNTPNIPLGLVKVFLDGGRVRRAYDRLLQLRTLSLPIRVITALRDYENMVIEVFDVNRTRTTGQVLAFTLGLKQIVTVRSQVVPVDLQRPERIPEPEEDRARSQGNVGQQPTELKTPDVKEQGALDTVRGKSIAKGLKDRAAAALGF